jgi:L-alanine-DL-glutamate epimerase-like enolase superfamily enzyme
MAAIRNNHTAKGAIDMAVHDALAQSAGRSLAEQLGATRDRVRVSYILGIGARDEVLAEAERVVAQGVRVLKVKVGRDWDEDIARIRDLQAMFGAAVDLYADANETMLAENAVARLAALRELGLRYCEEPLPVEQMRARAALRRGDAADHRRRQRVHAARPAPRAGAGHLRHPQHQDPAHRLHRVAGDDGAGAAAGKGIMVGSQAGSTIGTARAAIFAARPEVTHPSELSFFLKLREEITDRPLMLVDGWLDVRDALAVRIDPERLREMSSSCVTRHASRITLDG